MNPAYPFDYTFLDERYDRMYRGEKAISKLLGSFAILAIFVACLGLFGLASFAAQQRTREIGVRKVLGATTSQLLMLLSREFVWLVVIANLIGWPVAWYFMNQWLDEFAFHVDMSWWMFPLAGIVALLIAILTTSFQAYSSATANPVKSLRHE